MKEEDSGNPIRKEVEVSMTMIPDITNIKSKGLSDLEYHLLPNHKSVFVTFTTSLILWKMKQNPVENKSFETSLETLTPIDHDTEERNLWIFRLASKRKTKKRRKKLVTRNFVSVKDVS